MSDSDFALRLASPAELREMIATLTRERDEARADANRLRGALEGLADQAGSLLAELDYQQVSCPLCGEDLGDGDDALCRIVKALGETSDNARALIARLGEGE